MIEKALRELGIDKIGYYDKDKSYVVDIDDSDEWGEYDSILEKSDYDFLDEKSTLNYNNSNQVYQKDDLQISLIADFDNDLYKLVVQEV